MTKRIEGDSPTGSIVLFEYHKLKARLLDRLSSLSPDDTIKPMIEAMLKRTVKYMNEAMACDSLVLATVLNPAFRLGFFDIEYGENSKESRRASKLFQAAYTERSQKLDSRKSSVGTVTPSASSQKTLVFHLYAKPNKSHDLSEIERYLQGIDPMILPDKTADNDLDSSDSIDPNLSLSWWKVRDLLFLLPIQFINHRPVPPSTRIMQHNILSFQL